MSGASGRYTSFQESRMPWRYHESSSFGCGTLRIKFFVQRLCLRFHRESKWTISNFESSHLFFWTENIKVYKKRQAIIQDAMPMNELSELGVWQGVMNPARDDGSGKEVYGFLLFRLLRRFIRLRGRQCRVDGRFSLTRYLLFIRNLSSSVTSTRVSLMQSMRIAARIATTIE